MVPQWCAVKNNENGLHYKHYFLYSVSKKQVLADLAGALRESMCAFMHMYVCIYVYKELANVFCMRNLRLSACAFARLIKFPRLLQQERGWRRPCPGSRNVFCH
jgi:hypothetical protein